MKKQIKTILCYGDSNTYGYNPADGSRYPQEIRWTGLLQKNLGEDYLVINEGCNGRTTIFEDPAEPWKTGMFYVKPCMNTHKPVDMVVLMLGSNDLKKMYHASAAQIADGAGDVADEIRDFLKEKQGFSPQVVLAAPPQTGEAILTCGFRTQFDQTSIVRSKEFPEEYKRVAEERNCIFFNAGAYAQPSEIDGLHLSVESHKRLADGLCRFILDIMEGKDGFSGKNKDRNEEIVQKKEETNKKSPVKDLGTGSVPRLLLELAAPAVVAQIINLLYNIVDRIYIGHIPGIGAMALTGVGLCMPVIMLVNAFAMLAGTGGAPKAAIAMGQRNQKMAEQIMGNCFTLLLLLATGLTVVFLLFLPQLLRLFGASGVTLPYALAYSRIYVCGNIFIMTVLGMNPFITTQGFAKFSMLTTVIGAVCNIILDPILIFGLGMGVRGAAIATVFSQSVSAVWVLKFLTGRRTILHIRKENLPLKASIILPCLALGISTFVMMSTESILSISFTNSLSRYGGDVAVGAMTIITSVSGLVQMPLSGVCQGGQPVISFNFGAGNEERVKQAFRYQFLTCVIYSAALGILILIMPGLFAGIFCSDPALMGKTKWAMRIYMAGIFAWGFQTSCQQSFVALSQAKISLLLACLRKLILLIPLIFILPLFMQDKVFAVFLAEPVSDILAATVTTTMFFTRFNKILKAGPKQM